MPVIERSRLANVVRYARLKEAQAKGRHRNDQWQALLAVCGFKCVCCGASGMPLEKDHIQPIYLDGSDAIENLQPLCQRCNRQKGPDEIDYRPTGWPATIPPFRPYKVFSCASRKKNGQDVDGLTWDQIVAKFEASGQMTKPDALGRALEAFYGITNPRSLP
jgi:5-methylcytosine-specific restriction endonuclease McrA